MWALATVLELTRSWVVSGHRAHALLMLQPHLTGGGPVTPFTGSPRSQAQLAHPCEPGEGYCGAEGGSLPLGCDVLPPNPGVPHSHGGPCILHSTPSASYSPCSPTAGQPPC